MDDKQRKLLSEATKAHYWSLSEEERNRRAKFLRTLNIGRKKTAEHKAKISIALRGDKGPGWRGGVTPKNQMHRRSAEYKEWREAVFRRDGYACIWCGDNQGGNLEADHIMSFSEYEDLRFEVFNGRTLCEDCHKSTPNYGRNTPISK
jgi:hypothetical protein